MFCFIVLIFFFDFSLSFSRFTSKRTEQNCNGLTNCNGVCVDVSTDMRNCGQCGNGCHASEVCQNGQCATICPASQVPCNGWCTSLTNDINNCGACGRSCHANEVCYNSQCVVNGCPQPNHNSDVSFGYSLCGSQSITPDITQCTLWEDFRSHLHTSYGSVKISTTLGGSYSCNDTSVATALAIAIKSKTTFSSPCGGKIWSFCADNCGFGSYEIAVYDVLLNCDFCDADIAIRPCWCNFNWGGINTVTCFPPNQVLTLSFL